MRVLVLVGFFCTLSCFPSIPNRGKVLVILSSENKITVLSERGKALTVPHPTGFFLSELMVPVQALLDAGYEPVFANPKGNPPVMDKVSDSPIWFDGDRKRYQHARSTCRKLGVCGSEQVGVVHPKKLSEVRKDLASYAAVLVPGGHAPMEDLWKDSDLGAILKHAHEKQKPTALICHGPIALLSAATEGRGWIYKDYRMTVFSTKEEQQEEPGQDNVLGGYVAFYPDEALEKAGAKVLVRGAKWQSNVIEDRELITAQNPFSDKEFARKLVEALNRNALEQG